MRVPWFPRRVTGRGEAVSWTLCAPRERSDDEVALALRLIPLYRVFVRVGDPRRAARLTWPLAWRNILLSTLGAERAQRAMSEIRTSGFAIIAVCPRELAEHYRDELARHSLPCGIAPA
ncbi:MAG TPA: hypothetical protein VFU60_03575 [Ktedonobacterales bacterium]|nr:hypothetical protein [Ktedonobacterales bacterium]